MIAYLSIGTNIGNRLQNLQNAIDSLNLLPNTKVTDASNVYETDPVGFADQDNFLNIAVEVETKFSSVALLGALLGIESALGRVRLFKNGPRIIDLDLLMYENEIKNTDELVLPHPRMLEREFVLKPLCDLKSMQNNEFYNSALSKIENGGARIFNGEINF